MTAIKEINQNYTINTVSGLRIHLLYPSKKSNIGDRRRGQPESSLLNSYYTEV